MSLVSYTAPLWTECFVRHGAFPMPSDKQPQDANNVSVAEGLAGFFDLLAKFDYEDRLVSGSESAMPIPLADSDSGVSQG